MVVVSPAEALERELRNLGALDSALGAGAMVLALRLADPETNSSAAPAYQREIRETLAVLRAQAEPQAEDRMTKYERGLRVAS